MVSAAEWLPVWACPFATAIMLGGMGNACAWPPATPVHSLKSPVSNRAVQSRSDPTSSWLHPAASAASRRTVAETDPLASQQA